MQKLFYDTRKLDAACRKKYALSEELMMENAAAALETQIFEQNKDSLFTQVFILCGSGNNGADGYALARRLAGKINTKVFACGSPKSELCVIQSQRAAACGICILPLNDFFAEELNPYKTVVDCIFGSGFYGNFTGQTGELIEQALNAVNFSNCKKIACDVPSGLRADGTLAQAAFCADITVTMGADKICLYSDYAKDYAGIIKIADLGVSRSLFESSFDAMAEDREVFLLERSDMRLPLRTKNLVNKGSFGSAFIALGQKSGAALIAANACFKFGAGLVTLINPDKEFLKEKETLFPMELLSSSEFSSKVSALCVGMGLGRGEESADFYANYLIANPEVKCVLDADFLYSPAVLSVLEKRAEGCVLTPHPKEFSALLELCSLGTYSVNECVEKRIELVELFCKKIPGCVLLVKGSNPVIGFAADKGGQKRPEIFINPCGSPSLAKGGSGDCLAGMICSLLAQGYEPLDAAISADLAHSIAGQKVKNNYALTPSELIKNLGEL